MGSRLTVKDMLVVNEYTKNLQIIKDGALALKKAIIKVYGYDENDPNLAQKVWQKKKNLTKTDRMAELFACAGVDKPYLASKLKQLLEAESPVIYRGQISKDKEGNSIIIPDNRVQLQALSLLANILGVVQKGTSVDLSKEVNNLIVFVEDETSARRRVEEDVSRQQEIIQKSYTVEEEEEPDTKTE